MKQQQPIQWMSAEEIEQLAKEMNREALARKEAARKAAQAAEQSPAVTPPPVPNYSPTVLELGSL